MKLTKRKGMTMALGVTIAIIILIGFGLAVIAITNNAVYIPENNQTIEKEYSWIDMEQDPNINATMEVHQCQFEYVMVVCGKKSHNNIMHIESYLVQPILPQKYITSEDAIKYVDRQTYLFCEFIPEQSSKCTIGDIK